MNLCWLEIIVTRTFLGVIFTSAHSNQALGYLGSGNDVVKIHKQVMMGQKQQCLTEIQGITME